MWLNIDDPGTANVVDLLVHKLGVGGGHPLKDGAVDLALNIQYPVQVRDPNPRGSWPVSACICIQAPLSRKEL